MKTLLTDETLILRNDGTYIRDYVCVKDVISDYLFLLERIDKTRRKAFNLSSNDNFSVIDLIKKAESIFSQKIPNKIINTTVNEIPYQHLDYKKIDWSPGYRLETGLLEIYSWYKRIFLTKS